MLVIGQKATIPAIKRTLALPMHCLMWFNSI